jgi:outer membrane protein OmpA-like peptidoglycan-associated protein
MRRLPALALAAALLSAQGCPSAYQRTYDRETQRLEGEQRAADAQAAAEHAQASKYAAVVYFDVDSAVVGEDGQRELRWFVTQMRPYPQASVLVQGFADSTGTEAKNRSLSDDRARAVASYLSGQGIDPSRIVAQGYGTESPAGSNVTAKGRRSNRRAEVTVR